MHIWRKTEPAHRRQIFAEHTNISDPENPEIWLMRWDSTWESPVCFSCRYLVPQASSLGCCWSQDCRLAACLGSDPVKPFLPFTWSQELFFNFCISVTEVTCLRNKSLELISVKDSLPAWSIFCRDFFKHTFRWKIKTYLTWYCYFFKCKRLVFWSEKNPCLAFCFYQRHKLKLQDEYRKYKIGCLLILK